METASSLLDVLQGDCRDILPTLPAQSVQTCCTSPPYWGLRDYGTATWEGGKVGCDHLEIHPQDRPGRETPGGRGGSFPQSDRAYKSVCAKCGAHRIDSQLGLERTPEEYVANMVGVFREVWRVLRDDGSLWLNMGDSYATGTNADRNPTSIIGPDVPASWSNRSQSIRRHSIGLKPKDLCGIPWRLALALQAGFSRCTGCAIELRTDLWPVWNGHKFCPDCRASKIVPSFPGWYLRSEIIWAKPNPMPESVIDRPTKSHEQIFLLTKNGGDPLIWKARDTGEWSYKPDFSEMIDPKKRQQNIPVGSRESFRGGGDYTNHKSFNNNSKKENETYDNKIDDDKPIPRWKGFDYYYGADAIREPAEFGRRDWSNEHYKNGDIRIHHKGTTTGANPEAGRNRRSVWTVAEPEYRLRSDLTLEQRCYVLQRIVALDCQSSNGIG